MGKERYLRYVQSVFFQHVHLGENLSWSSLHYYMALVHNIYMVCVNDFLHVVSDQNYCYFFLSVQLMHCFQNLFPAVWIQHSCRFVKYNTSWTHCHDSVSYTHLFLYNTLDIIRWEAMYEADGESPVTEMIEKFSRLCRLGMKTGGNTITLREGIEHASIYLDVINFRHSEKIQLFLETEVDDQSVYIPQFILQPIMENAVVHAFGDASSGYFIRIHSSACDNVLHILVEDNGRGMEDVYKRQGKAVRIHIRTSIRKKSTVKKRSNLHDLHSFFKKALDYRC